ncbi:MAG: hypothetical protein KJ597_03800 [Nanoarchaeota archaeon]|nr:hypothetical protein [Nanoarchaeota archaeon]MBU1622670.1 hypothetical protein [Nanoarchaeota archaeon]
MNKKAASVLMMVFEVLVVVFVVFMVISTAKSYAESDTVIKINAANDFVMMIDVLIATPGDAVVEYPYNLSKFIILIDSGGILIEKPGDSEMKRVIRSFHLPESYSAFGGVREIENVCLEKTKKDIILRECDTEEFV